MALDYGGDFVKVPREAIDTLLRDPCVLQVYLECLRRARWGQSPHYDRRYRELHIGQLFVGRDELAQRCRSTVQQVRRALRVLADLRYIAKETTNRGHVITMLGYGEKRTESLTRSPAEQPSSNPRTFDKRPAANPTITTIKKVRPEERDEEACVGEAIQAFDCLYEGANGGHRCTWGATQRANMRALVARHGIDDVCRAIEVLFIWPPSWLRPPFDFRTFMANFDKLLALRHHDLTQ